VVFASTPHAWSGGGCYCDPAAHRHCVLGALELELKLVPMPALFIILHRLITPIDPLESFIIVVIGIRKVQTLSLAPLNSLL
jgi:hypothetical protein